MPCTVFFCSGRGRQPPLFLPACPLLTSKEPEGEPASGAGDTVTAAGQAGSSLFESLCEHASHRSTRAAIKGHLSSTTVEALSGVLLASGRGSRKRRVLTSGCPSGASYGAWSAGSYSHPRSEFAHPPRVLFKGGADWPVGRSDVRRCRRSFLRIYRRQWTDNGRNKTGERVGEKD